VDGLSRILLGAALLLVLQVLLKGCSSAPVGQIQNNGAAQRAAYTTADSARMIQDSQEQTGLKTQGGGLLRILAQELKTALYESFAPGIAFVNQGGRSRYWLLQGQIDSLLPIYSYLDRGEGTEEEAQQSEDFRTILMAEAEEGGLWEAEEANDIRGEDPDAVEQEELPDTASDRERLDELLRAENEAAGQDAAFVPRTQLQQIDLAPLADYETLVGQFYTIDANTMIGSDQLNLASLLGADMTVSKESEGPQILIYHTHSQEAFADSVAGDESTTIMGVGDRLEQILTERYGYQVLHYRGKYDVETRNDAYSNALPDIEKLLQEHPSIQVVIDLHRDEMPEGTRLVMDVDGRPTARFMFFNGLSRTKKTGNIAYLYNENLDSNLAFSFQMQMKAMEYYPGLTRRIYLKGYRYNMHLCPKSLLIELGAQNNTVEEAMNACDPLAHILDLVLSGQ